MHEHKEKTTAKGKYDRITLIGNPNVGKSVIFGLLTGKYVTVSNYPGTTVEVSYGNITLNGKQYSVVDTPGVNSLIPMSEDEKVTRDILLNERPSLILQVSDAKNLKRTLLLTIQLAETGIPLVLDLNMEDEARDRGIIIDSEKLKEILGVEVIGTIAPQRKGLGELRDALLKPASPKLSITYNPVIEEYAEKVSALLPEANISKRSLSMMILAGDESLKDWLTVNLQKDDIKRLEVLRNEAQEKFNQPLSLVINHERLKTAEDIVKEVTKRVASEGGKVSAFIGHVSMHPVWGIPLLLAVLYGIYEFVGIFGAGTLVGLLEETVFGVYLNPWAEKIVKAVVPIAFFEELLVGEYGLITMALTYAIAIILPITTTFFIAFAILEDTGYLPRLAIMSNRVFNIMGLNGKAVLPMVLGLGCGTMAVMTSRILESKRERIITTFLLALAIPCSAQLGVILGMLGALSIKATAIWIGSVILVLFFSGYLASKILPGEREEFFLEIPPIRKPILGNIIVKTIGRVEWYLKEAVPLFILGTLILFVLHKFNLLIWIEAAVSPVIVSFLGLPAKTAEAFILGFLRRDYGAAGLFAMAEKGLLTPHQSLVSLVTITLFVPCLANFFMIVKERGLKMALGMIAIIFPVAFVSGGILNWVLKILEVSL
ncbi:MAG: ferrous iron transport protein B [Nitrospirae bacterium]|nr:ferrous iron transport protein B [Nitrospirota bacterium]